MKAPCVMIPIREDGSIRNSSHFSLIDTEWEYAKKNLETVFQNKFNT